ncbi:MAG: 50S ribosomal protein L17 [Cutibacterium granulosum]|uniref:50S ribosomal protein L17 n=1 Tax=Cutibacterium granulosum TaxID=33011 RepID=UPI002B235415|nr:50S ribosomal protein L17 [Cutibacterium granulosum]MEA5645355.1 50S ribosomal protein L17 [Cutibacterium granulosum]
MPQPMKGPRFGGNAAHSRIILRNLTSQLFEHGRVVTTLAKAKQVRPIAEKLITRAKVDTVANRRIVNRTITDKGVSHVLFTEIAPMMAERNGGYTRITRIGDRKGDAAPMAVIELVTDKPAAKDTADDVKAKIEQADESASAESAEDAPAVPVAADEAESEADAPAEETSADKA